MHQPKLHFGDMAAPEYGLVFASEDLLANEILSYAWLVWNREFETSLIGKTVNGLRITCKRTQEKKIIASIIKTALTSMEN